VESDDSYAEIHHVEADFRSRDTDDSDGEPRSWSQSTEDVDEDITPVAGPVPPVPLHRNENENEKGAIGSKKASILKECPKWLLLLMAVFTALLLAGLIVAIVLGLRNRDENDNDNINDNQSSTSALTTEPVPTESPSMAPPTPLPRNTPSMRPTAAKTTPPDPKQLILEYLSSVVGNDVYTDGALANTAANWLLETDPIISSQIEAAQPQPQTQTQTRIFDQTATAAATTTTTETTTETTTATTRQQVIYLDLDTDETSRTVVLQRFLLAWFYYSTTSTSTSDGGTTSWVSCNPPPQGTPLEEECVFQLPVGYTGTALSYAPTSGIRWLSAANECDWQGITCVDGQVTWIDIGTYFMFTWISIPGLRLGCILTHIVVFYVSLLQLDKNFLGL
jgi:hypothetical protein